MPAGHEPMLRKTESALEVSVELPGIDQKDVDVSLTDSAFTIKWERKSQRENNKPHQNISKINSLPSSYSQQL